MKRGLQFDGVGLTSIMGPGGGVGGPIVLPSIIVAMVGNIGPVVPGATVAEGMPVGGITTGPVGGIIPGPGGGIMPGPGGGIMPGPGGGIMPGPGGGIMPGGGGMPGAG